MQLQFECAEWTVSNFLCQTPFIIKSLAYAPVSSLASCMLFRVGGLVQAIAWDQHDERLAVLCQGKYTIHCGSKKKMRQLWRTITTTQFSRF